MLLAVPLQAVQAGCTAEVQGPTQSGMHCVDLDSLHCLLVVTELRPWNGTLASFNFESLQRLTIEEHGQSESAQCPRKVTGPSLAVSGLVKLSARQKY